MQQLTFKFEGFADQVLQPETQGTAKQCKMKVNELSPGWAMTQTDPAAALRQVIDNVMNYGSRRLARVRAAAAALIPSLVLLAQASLCVCFGFALMFLAAIIGG